MGSWGRHRNVFLLQINQINFESTDSVSSHGVAMALSKNDEHHDEDKNTAYNHPDNHSHSREFHR
jgi:hypothetical protein